ncbi:MAG: nucleoside-triphosphatase [Desulfomonilia bacterium]
MECIQRNILITGAPGIGKTTLFKRLMHGCAAWSPMGFYSGEIREKGIRTGFSLVGFDGRKGILAGMNIHSEYRVGRYRVNVKGFEKFLEGFDFFHHDCRLVMIDEIGRMECYSAMFRRIITELLDSDTRVVSTIALKGGGLIASIKERPDVEVIEVTLRTRDSVIPDIVNRIGRCMEKT